MFCSWNHGRRKKERERGKKKARIFLMRVWDEEEKKDPRELQQLQRRESRWRRRNGKRIEGEKGLISSLLERLIWPKEKNNNEGYFLLLSIFFLAFFFLFLPTLFSVSFVWISYCSRKHIYWLFDWGSVFFFSPSSPSSTATNNFCLRVNFYLCVWMVICLCSFLCVSFLSLSLYPFSLCCFISRLCFVGCT